MNKNQEKYESPYSKCYYDFESLYIDDRAYNLVWDYDDNELTNSLIIIDCYRERNMPRKTNVKPVSKRSSKMEYQLPQEIFYKNNLMVSEFQNKLTIFLISQI